MLRKYGWLAIALLVVVDVVLVSWAMRHSQDDPDASGPVTVTFVHTVTQTPSAPVQSGTVAPSDTDDPSTTPTSTASGNTTSATTRSVAPSTPSTTPSTPSTTPNADTTTPSTSPATPTRSTAANGLVTDAAARAVMLDMSGDGYVIRAIRGTCPASAGASAALIQVSDDRGVTWTTVKTNSPAVLRVVGWAKGHLWYVAADNDCAPVEQDTRDSGDTWQEKSADGAWALDPDATSSRIVSPKGPVDVGCTPLAMSTPEASEAVVACTDGQIRASTDVGSSWKKRSTIKGVVALSFADSDTGYALAPKGDCPAAVLATTDGGSSWHQAACLDGEHPRAIAVAANQLLAQVDGTIYFSANSGTSWKVAK